MDSMEVALSTGTFKLHPVGHTLEQSHLRPQLTGEVPGGGEPGEPGVGLSSTRPSSLCKA